MAFLCPVRIRRGKKKIRATTGSSSVDLDTKDASITGGHQQRLGSGSSTNNISSISGSGVGGVGGGGINGNNTSGGSASGGGGGGGMGRITGSASIETLVRVGIEKENGLSPDSKMIVLHDFTPCVDDELDVRRGQCVNVLYRENDWVYVIGQDSRQEGFIPHSYCAPYNTQLADLAIKKKLPRGNGDLMGGSASLLAGSSVDVGGMVGVGGGIVDGVGGGGGGGGGGSIVGGADMLPDIQAELMGSAVDDCGGSEQHHQALTKQQHSSQASLCSEMDYLPFAKDPSGRFIVLYTFIARDENDVSVERGEFVTVLNREDHEWFWIVRSDGLEGFIPSGFVYPNDSVVLQDNTTGSNTLQAANSNYNYNSGSNINNNNGTSKPHQQHTTDNISEHVNHLMSTAIASAPNNGQLSPGGASQTNQQHVADVAGGVGAATAPAASNDELCYHGTELVMLYDYKAQAPDDLSVRRGDWIYADLNNQTVDGWIWAYTPKTRKYGFIPKAYARPPAMTSL